LHKSCDISINWSRLFEINIYLFFIISTFFFWQVHYFYYILYFWHLTRNRVFATIQMNLFIVVSASISLLLAILIAFLHLLHPTLCNHNNFSFSLSHSTNKHVHFCICINEWMNSKTICGFCRFSYMEEASTLFFSISGWFDNKKWCDIHKWWFSPICKLHCSC
jgi:hypothetical protein